MTTSASTNEPRKAAGRPRAFRPTTALALSVDFSDDMMHVQLTDGRVLSAPLAWFPAFQGVTLEQLKRCTIGGGGKGLHWEELDEDLSVAGLLAGGSR